MLRKSSPDWIQRIWDAIVKLQGKLRPRIAVPKERLLNCLCEDLDVNRDDAEAELVLAVADGLVVALKVEDDGSQSFVLPLIIKKYDHDWYCFHCHMGGRDDSMDCELCFRMFHLHCAAGYSGLPVWSEKLCPVCLLDPMTMPDQSVKELNELLESVISKFLGFSCLNVADGKVWAMYSDRKFADKWRYNFLVHTSISGTEMQEKALNKRYSSLRMFMKDCELLAHNLAVYFGRSYGKIPWVEKFQNIVFNAVTGIQKCPDCFRRTLSKKRVVPTLCTKQHYTVQLGPPGRFPSPALQNPGSSSSVAVAAASSSSEFQVAAAEDDLNRETSESSTDEDEYYVVEKILDEDPEDTNYYYVSWEGCRQNSWVHKKHIPLELLDRFHRDTAGTRTYRVERIVDDGRFNGQMNYLVKWDGYSSDSNSWEPEEHILDSQLIKDYYRGKFLAEALIRQTKATSSKRGKVLRGTNKTNDSGFENSEKSSNKAPSLEDSICPAKRSRLRKTPCTNRSGSKPCGSVPSGRTLRSRHGPPKAAGNKDSSPVGPKRIIRFGRSISGFRLPGSRKKPPSGETQRVSREASSSNKSTVKGPESSVVIEDQNSGAAESLVGVFPNISTSTSDSGVDSSSSPGQLLPSELSGAGSHSSLMDWDETLDLIETAVESDDCLTTLGRNESICSHGFGNPSEGKCSFSSCNNFENILSG